MLRWWRSWMLALAGVVSAVVPPAAWSQSSPVAASPPAPAREVRAWLMRIHEAASRRNFEGTFVVSGGGAVSSARIAHFCEGKNEFERSESLDGQARHVFRHNEAVYTVWPDSRVALVEQRDVPASFPAMFQAGDDHIVDFYDVRANGVDRVAGHAANVLLVEPKDDYRYGYRLWADQASGLLLRADVIGKHGVVLETSAFSDVVIGVKPKPESVLQPIRRLAGYQILRPLLKPTRLEDEGWRLAEPAAGFRQVSCVRRPMDGASVGRVDSAGEQVVQAIYSDGLTYVSLFIEDFDAQRHKPMEASVGATRTLTKRHGGWWLTVVGDVPLATLHKFADRLERSR